MAKILLVEDHPSVRESTTWLLEACGHQVTAVATGEEALAAKPDGFDVIVLDLNMPGMGGKAFKRHLDARRVNVPVIVLSAEGDVAQVALSVGALRAIRKPASFVELQGAIAAALASKRVSRSGRPD